MSLVVLTLLLLAFVLFALAGVGVVHARVEFVPLGLAACVLAQVLRLWPP